MRALYSHYSKKILIPLVVVAVFAAILKMGGGFFAGLNNSSEDKMVAKLGIEIGENKRMFEGEVVDGMTVLEALQAATLAGNITFNYIIDGQTGNLLIKSLDGYEERKNKTLLFYLNSAPIETYKIHEIKLSPGDVIAVKDN